MRSLLPWLVVPNLVTVGAAGLVVARTTGAERTTTARLAFESVRGERLRDASTLVDAEIVDLIELDAFTEVPPELADLWSDAWDVSDERAEVLDDLAVAESSAASIGHDLRELVDVPIEVSRVLDPVAPEIRDRLHRGDVGVVPPGDHVRARRWLDQQADLAQSPADEADRGLLRIAHQPPYWRTTEFALLIAALALLGGLCSMLALWRTGRMAYRLRGSRRDATQAAARFANRAERLRSLMEVGRSLSIDAEPGVIASTIAEEARRAVGSDACVLAMVQDGWVTPSAWHGPVHPAPVAFRQGLVGRVADAGATARAVSGTEASLPGSTGPLSLLVTPVTRDGRVVAVLTAVRRGDRPFSVDDETVLELVATMSAGAMRAAERYGTTLALAHHDPLTGLANRRRLDHDLDAGPEPVAFLMIDIDHFKQFNDRHGHPAGDELLRRVGEAIAGAVRTGDVAYRFGGEEFSVLLPGTDAPTATHVAERIRAAVAGIGGAARDEPVTVSIGVSAGVGGADGGAALVEAADRALYDAKRAGRDRIVVAGSGAPSIGRGAEPRPGGPAVWPAPGGRLPHDGPR